MSNDTAKGTPCSSCGDGDVEQKFHTHEQPKQSSGLSAVEIRMRDACFNDMVAVIKRAADSTDGGSMLGDKRTLELLREAVSSQGPEGFGYVPGAEGNL